ncbi:hypothetical protein C2S52_018468 [Perilla frutescens var. hirtella]|nr:hypothetical protein C2S52_018468 [Perilla frutescens var. hirtella]KAH6812169.1 hypothetical protein C2S51_025931 [Perilla frutescens var. frutescens]
MEIRRCKVCFRNFANGRALGGHMRSHKNINASKLIEEMDEINHSCSSSDDPEFSVVLQDGESGSESSRNNPFATGRRSKRSRKKTRVISNLIPSKMVMRRFGETNDQQSPSSSVSDTTTTEEDVAHCLMMLSRDKWERENEEEDDDEDSEHVEVKVKVMIKSNAKLVRGKYRCETCNKLFKSYQALGGHRASYKKIKSDVVAVPNDGGGPVAAEEKLHECPFCHRVFASGQALGGHKSQPCFDINFTS